jgi:AraC-like DNA-binding protein
VVCGEQVHVDTTDHEARVRFDWPHVAQSPPTLLVEVTLASIVALANYGTGHALVPVRIELARTRGDEFMLQKAFGCPIQFDAPHDVLVLERAALACPFITSNAELVAMLLPVLESAVEEVSITRSLADDVRATLRRSMSGERPSVDKVAEAVRLSPRTLQRRLGELGTSCQSMLDDVRRDTARRLLTHTDLDACEVAFLVGFEELDSFTRAFATWEGMTPSRWRGRTDAAGGAR